MANGDRIELLSIFIIRSNSQYDLINDALCYVIIIKRTDDSINGFVFETI